MNVLEWTQKNKNRWDFRSLIGTSELLFSVSAWKTRRFSPREMLEVSKHVRYVYPTFYNRQLCLSCATLFLHIVNSMAFLISEFYPEFPEFGSIFWDCVWTYGGVLSQFVKLKSGAKKTGNVKFDLTNMGRRKKIGGILWRMEKKIAQKKGGENKQKISLSDKKALCMLNNFLPVELLKWESITIPISRTFSVLL